MKKTTFLFKSVFLFVLAATFSSCSSDDDSPEPVVEPETSSITISSNTTNLTSNSEEAFTFTVKDEDGNDVTSASTVYVNDNTLDGNTFSSTEIGTYEAYAKKGDLTSNKISVSISEEPISYYKQKPLIEDYTGVWCGYCPRVMTAIDRVHEQTNDVVVAALHRAQKTNPNAYGYDPYTFEPAAAIANAIWDKYEFPSDQRGYPLAGINRLELWEYPESNNAAQVVDLVQNRSPYGIAINSDLGASNGTIDLKIAFAEDINTPVKYVVYVAENGLIQNQVNYTYFYGGSGNPEYLVDFQHDNVVRSVANDDIFGTAIPSAQTKAGETFEVTLNTSYTVENADNLEVIAFIVDADGNSLNAQVAPGNTDMDFEVVE